MENETLIVVFSGYNQRAIIAFLRTCRSLKVKCKIVAKSKDDEIFLTLYSTDVIFVREKKELSIVEFTKIFNQIKTEYKTKKIFVPPTTEALNRFLLKNKELFESQGVVIPLVSLELYEMISDKYSFSNYVKDYGLKVPAELNCNTIPSFPIMAKPRIYKYDTAPIIIENESDFCKVKENQDYYFQEFITGESFYLLFYIDKNKTVFSLSQQNFLQQADGKSIVAATTSDVHTQEIGRLYSELIINLNFHGFIMIELRKHDDEYYMIEANPRFWGPSQLFVDSDYNFFEYFLYDYGFIDFPEKKNFSPAKYFWFGGIAENIKAGKKIAKFSKKKIDFISWSKFDIYNRYDTKQIYNKEVLDIETEILQLKNLYEERSKHSNYQILASNFENIIDVGAEKIISRYEKERFEYMKNKIDFSGRQVLDIGGNTGYFSFECVNENARHLEYYEGNQNHCEFVRLGSKIFKLEDKISVNNRYYKFPKKGDKIYDIALLLNVLHHIGDDYGDKDLAINSAKISIINQLNSLSTYCKRLVFQLGFNWKGNRNVCLFDKGTKQEMIDFIKDGVKDCWNILYIGIAEIVNNQVFYNDLSETNILRNDSLGEFLNRPIFILETKFKI